jgi:hypothetical protein
MTTDILFILHNAHVYHVLLLLRSYNILILIFNPSVQYPILLIFVPSTLANEFVLFQIIHTNLDKSACLKYKRVQISRQIYRGCIFLILLLRGRVIITSVLYHEVSHQRSASVRIQLAPISVVSPQIHCIMYLGSLFHQ